MRGLQLDASSESRAAASGPGGEVPPYPGERLEIDEPRAVRLFGATGESVVRLDETGDSWVVEVALAASPVLWLAVDSFRRRRGSLHYKRTGSLAEVAELLGDSKRVAADHYVYALTDYREIDRSIAPARSRA